MVKKAFITGITGQDGSYLAEFLLKKGYEVAGLWRRTAKAELGNIEHIKNEIKIYEGDLQWPESVVSAFYDFKPDEIYNLAAQSSPLASFREKIGTMMVTGLGAVQVFERAKEIVPSARIYQACHSDDTQVVTSNGIKKYTQLTKDDLILSINLENNQLEFKKFSKVHEFDYDGEMYHFLSRRQDILVTPNHKMLLQYNDDKFKFIEADQVESLLKYRRNSHISLPMPRWEGKDPTTIVFSDYIDMGLQAINNYRNLITEMNASDFCYLMGLYIGDGYTQRKRKAVVRYQASAGVMLSRDSQGRFMAVPNLEPIEVEYESNYIQFAVPKKDKAREKLVEVLRRNNLIFNEHEITIELSSIYLARMFKLAGESVYEKRIPSWMLSLSKNLLMRLFEGLIDSDGYGRELINGGKRFSYTTVSEHLARGLVELSYKIGRIPSVKICPARRVYFKQEKRFLNASKCFIINFQFKNKNKIYKENIRKVNYKGKVWCLEVNDNHNFLTLRNGKFAFTGNSTSEMFGAPKEVPQNENTLFNPANPYAAAKVYAHYMAHLARIDGHKPQFISCGILFNHECITALTPVILREENGLINICAIEDIVPHRENPRHGIKYTTIIKKPFEIWDGDHWTQIKTLTATWNKAGSPNDKKVKAITCRGGYYEATSDHLSFLEGEKAIATAEIKIGDNLELKTFPTPNQKTIMSKEEAEFIGLMVADGYIHKEGKGRFINSDPKLREKAKQLWQEVGGGNSRDSEHPSGFSPGELVPSVEFSGNSYYLKYLQKEIYSDSLFKKVPKRILNADKEIINSFLRGYNMCDGLKAGRQKTEYKCFTSNSSILALGLWYLINIALGTRITLHPEKRGERLYFHLNINSPQKTLKGKHLVRTINEVKDIVDLNYTGWLFDLETKSGTFSAGVGLTWMHNSPRRGLNFVTRKISSAVACIKNGKLKLGDLSAKRDWGYAPDYVEVMWMILQAKKADDFVIATGEIHTVEDFAREAFAVVGLDYKEYVITDPTFVPPIQTGPLCGDSTKAQKVLGWKPKTTFKDLVKIMVYADLAKFS